MKCNRRARHSRVASLAALPQFTFCPHPAGCKFIGSINLVKGRPLASALSFNGCVGDHWSPLRYTIASDFKRRGEGTPPYSTQRNSALNLRSFAILHFPFSIMSIEKLTC